MKLLHIDLEPNSIRRYKLACGREYTVTEFPDTMNALYIKDLQRTSYIGYIFCKSCLKHLDVQLRFLSIAGENPHDIR